MTTETPIQPTDTRLARSLLRQAAKRARAKLGNAWNTLPQLRRDRVGAELLYMFSQRDTEIATDKSARIMILASYMVAESSEDGNFDEHDWIVNDHGEPDSEYIAPRDRMFAKELASRLAAMVPDLASADVLILFACDLGDEVSGPDVDRSRAQVINAAKAADQELESE